MGGTNSQSSTSRALTFPFHWSDIFDKDGCPTKTSKLLRVRLPEDRHPHHWLPRCSLLRHPPPRLHQLHGRINGVVWPGGATVGTECSRVEGHVIRNLHHWCGHTDRLNLLHRHLCLPRPRRQNEEHLPHEALDHLDCCGTRH